MQDYKTVVQLIGEEAFRWLAQEFHKKVTLADVPDDILERVASVDVTLRDYSSDRNALTCIALITFAYKLAGKPQQPHFGAKDMMLAKVLAKNELARRKGKRPLTNPYWKHPLYWLIAGEVGERIRSKLIPGI
ncbi:MAG: hypothetical protein JRH08_14335 [Deltaproteobacteria bacterium]|nr:hypothetical protein [Deltaproteobacteria bacterium]MBW1930362.1 hypothetical protein [Deltaproteobacteria bacterium]MBW2024036.1 hypothetical protein [Deltaproteobacteria bacterium]MBW2126818.1 hypothetical protein [Deltaproteobacteria bacterium]RLB12895.1 MAG: hypothetical protein DRG63_11125 [Deltaproteobacteria bacterium]